MRTKFLLLLLAATVAMGVVAASASASGPAPPGKDLVQIACDGLGTVTVSVQRGQNSNGAGQIVGQKGHGIPVQFTFTLTDVTTATIIDSETAATGHGNGHPNQPATHCSGVLFEGAASDFFGPQLPPGVAPTDTIQASLDGFVIVKQ